MTNKKIVTILNVFFVACVLAGLCFIWWFCERSHIHAYCTCSGKCCR
jgi:hypothetical protein